MAAVTMSFEEVYAQLKAWGLEQRRAMYTRNGAGESFGVLLGNLRGLARKLKQDHPLALRLWGTGNLDAMIMATMLMDPKQLAEAEATAMVEALTYHGLVDELAYTVLADAPFAETLRLRWMDSPAELPGRAGWDLLTARLQRHQLQGLDFDAILQKIEAEVQSAPKRKQEAMNRTLCEIGIRFPEWTQRCIELGERLGRLDPNERVPKGCTSSYAPEWIAAGIRLRQARGGRANG